MRIAYLALAAAAYAFFFAVFLYLIGFVENVPFLVAGIDRGAAAQPATAALIDVGLIALFGLQHSVMARPAFKARWTRIVPAALERSAYVVASSLCLAALIAFWHPIAGDLWRVDGAAAVVLWAVSATGWAIVLLSTFLLGHFELFGLAQVYRNWRGTSAADPRFRTPLFYRLVRHPLYSGFLLAFWATPAMTVGHLLFAAGMTIYVVIAIRHEERDLVATFGGDYVAYQESTGMLVPGVGRRA